LDDQGGVIGRAPLLPAQILESLPGTDPVRQATISGSRGTSGKCTIEVRVDIAAEVDVYGDSGRLRTLAGQPATWTRMECTDPLPYNMTDFKFKGIDGRGKVVLQKDPRGNNSMAVIRIDDPRGGAEGYTFDIEWSGASGGAPTGGFAVSTGQPPTGQTPVTRSGRAASTRSRRGTRNLTAERAIDLCGTAVKEVAERDYNLRNIDITQAGLDTTPGREDWVTGTFTSRTGNFRRGSGYRFNCAMDYNAGHVRGIELMRADGTLLPVPSATAAAGGQYDQARVFRACQDAVVSRAARDGYQNLSFSSTAIDANRSGWVIGTVTATRGPVSDTFDFGCSMDFSAATLRNLEFTRR
jgi:hypothetical protein